MRRIAVVGAGAIGGYAGAHMTRAGHDVTLIDAWPEHVEAMRSRGLQLSGMTPAETVTAKVNALHISDVQQVVKQRPFDIAFLCVKSYDTEWATHLIKDYLAPDGFVVSLQNCINEERIAAIVGWGKVLGCIASLIAGELVAPGRVKRTIHLGGEHHIVYRVGEVHGRHTQRAQDVANLLASADSSKVTTNLWGERWSKLVINSMRNGLSAATGLSGNERDGREDTRRLSIRLGSEAVRVGQALGFNLETMLGMEAETLARAGEGSSDALTEIENVLIEGSKGRADDQRPSMGQDMFKGRRTETDFINGFVAQKGMEIGVPALTHAKMNEAVKRVERGEVKASPEIVTGF
ncbi:MAG: 2-dehydropantoate 2-reductase [Burkholderiales bacterium]